MPNPIPSRPPRPKPLVILLLVITFFGGSCTVQDVMTAGREAPSKQEVAEVLKSQAAGAPEAAKSLDALVDASHAYVVAHADVSWRFRPFLIAFGLLLVVAYSFTSVFAMRALAFAPGAAKPLATAALLVLPARVAFSAVEVASARAMQPALTAMATAYAKASSEGMPAGTADQFAAAMGRAAPWLTVAVHGAFAVGVCVLFFFASRYFQRPEVVALYAVRERPER